MIRELRGKREELQAERKVIDAKLAAINTVIDIFEGKGGGINQEALTSETSGDELQMSEIIESSPPTKPKRRSLTPPESEGSSANGHSEKIAITQEVREAVQELEGEFKTQDVVERIKAKYPWAEIKPTPVSTALGRMVKRKEGIRVVREGEGWEPNIYERYLPDPPAQENRVAEENAVSG